MSRTAGTSKENQGTSSWKPQEYQGDLHAKDRLLSSVHKISSLLTRPVALDTVLTAIVEETSHVFGYDRVAIYLVSKDRKRLECKYEIGFTPEEMEIAFQRPFSLERHECIETMVVKTGQTVYIRDYEADSRVTYLDRKVSAKQNRFATIAVPLHLRESIIGLIEADRGGYPLVLTEEDIQHLSIFANQASIIIENTRLYEQLVNERNFAENVVESSPNCILVVNCDETIRTINEMTEDFFGLEKERVQGRASSEVFEGPFAAIIREAIDGRITESRELVIRRKQGGRAVLGVSSSQLKSRDGTVLGAVLIARDLTEAKRSEEWMRRMDRLTSLGQLSAGIAHEIRNPLASINFNVQFLARQLNPDEKTRRIIDDTLTGVDRIKDLVKGMLDFCRPAPPKLKSDSIHRCHRGCRLPAGVPVPEERHPRGTVPRTGRPRHRLRQPADPSGLRQHPAQRHAGHAEGRHRPGGEPHRAGCEKTATAALCHHQRQRRRDPEGGFLEDLRPLLHDQTGGDGAGALHRPQDPGAAPRRDRSQKP